MKLAASDYDGTLFRHQKVTDEDLRAIHQWRLAGHLFGLATGRDLNLTMVEIESKNIEYDFIVCNTGASVYIRDEAGALKNLLLMELPPQAAQKVLRHPATRNSNYWVLCQKATSWLAKQVTEKEETGSWLEGLGLPLTPIGWEKAEKLEGLQQISLEYNSPEEAARAVESLLESFGRDMSVHLSTYSVDITAKGASKAEGLLSLLQITGWPTEEILVIGDTENDLSMIRRFNGFAVPNATDEVKQAAHKIYESPGQMLLAHL